MCIFLFPSLLLHSKRDECRIETTVCVVPVICVVFLLLLLLLSLKTRSRTPPLVSFFFRFNPTCNEDVSLNCNQSVFFVSFLVQILRFKRASAFPPFGVFSREISRFFFFFFASLTQKRRTEMKAFRSFNALSSRREFLFFSEFLFFERRSDARDSLLRGEKRTRTRSRSREPSFGER